MRTRRIKVASIIAPAQLENSPRRQADRHLPHSAKLTCCIPVHSRRLRKLAETESLLVDVREVKQCCQSVNGVATFNKQIRYVLAHKCFTTKMKTFDQHEVVVAFYG